MARRVIPTAFPADPQLTTCEELGAAVRAARTASGLTLEEAALAVSIAKQALRIWKQGGRLSGSALPFRVAKALGVSLFVAPAGEASSISRLIRESRE